MPRFPRPTHGWDIRDEDPDYYDATGQFAGRDVEPPDNDRASAGAATTTAANDPPDRNARWRGAVAPVGFGLAAAALTLALGVMRPHARVEKPVPTPRYLPAPSAPRVPAVSASVAGSTAPQAHRAAQRPSQPRRRPTRRRVAPAQHHETTPAAAAPRAAPSAPPAALAPRTPSVGANQEFVIGAR